MIIASCASFHASNTMFKKLPGLDKLIKENPQLLSKQQDKCLMIMNLLNLNS